MLAHLKRTWLVHVLPLSFVSLIWCPWILLQLGCWVKFSLPSIWSLPLHCPPGTIWHQLILQPDKVFPVSVLKESFTVLLELTISSGTTLPQLFSSNIFPSPSMISRWSPPQKTAKAVNVSLIPNPLFTVIVSVFWRLLGYNSGYLGEVTIPVKRINF